MHTLIVNEIKAALRDRKGISAMEYAILAATILAVVSTAMTSLGGEITAMVAAVIAKLQALVV